MTVGSTAAVASATSASDETARPSRGGWRLPLLAYVIAFLALALPFLGRLASAVPQYPNLDDAHVLPWVLAWVAHALAVDPRHLFDANVSYPAPLQLTGTDPLFASQLVFAPLYALTRNPVLSANLVVLLSYPLAGLAMERLLRRFAVSGEVAWAAGLVFALGALRVPFNLNEIAYPNLFLPWAALALTRLRDQPTPRRAAILCLAFTIGIFAGLYAAVLLGLTCALWGLFEALRSGPGRLRFLALALCAAAVGGALLFVAIHPYLATAAWRAGTAGTAGNALRFKLSFATPGDAATSSALLLALLPQSVGLQPRHPVEMGMLIVAGLVAIGAGARRACPATRLVPRAAVLWLLGGTLACGYPEPIASIVEASPLVSFRYVYRFVVPADLGLVLLLAVTLETVRTRLGVLAGRVAVVATLLVVLWSRGLPFAATPMHEVVAFTPGARAAHAVAARIIAAGGGGPVLELPIYGRLPGAGDDLRTLEPDAMLASTLDWWPTPAAHLSYHPPHRAFFMAAVSLLPAPHALDDLIDLTHVRWLLLRPEEAWPPRERDRFARALATSPEVGQVSQLPAGWTLLRLDRKPEHPGWFAYVRSGGAPGHSVLGSPLAVLPEDEARSTVRITSPLERGVAGQKVAAVITVRNDGDRAWAGLATPTAPLTLDGRWGAPVSHTGTVTLVERWRRLGADGEPGGGVVAQHQRPLRRDVDPGEELRQMTTVTLPAEPGAYQLELGVEQIDGARFTGPGNSPARRRIEVTAAPAGQG